MDHTPLFFEYVGQCAEKSIAKLLPVASCALASGENNGWEKNHGHRMACLQLQVLVNTHKCSIRWLDGTSVQYLTWEVVLGVSPIWTKLTAWATRVAPTMGLLTHQNMGKKKSKQSWAKWTTHHLFFFGAPYVFKTDPKIWPLKNVSEDQHVARMIFMGI